MRRVLCGVTMVGALSGFSDAVAAPCGADCLVAPAAIVSADDRFDAWAEIDVPPRLEAESASVCPFAPADPLRVARVLNHAGIAAVEAEAPYRDGHSRVCTR